MWPRVVELMLGVWLTISPFIFGHPSEDLLLWINDLGCGTLVVAFSCLSYWEATMHSRFATLAVSLWLIVGAYFAAGHPAAPALQNEFLVGMLLAMFAIIPNEASRPPRSWREFVR